MQEKLVRFSERFEREGDRVRAREYAQIYRLVMDLLDQVVSLIGEEESCPEEFARILEAGFEEIQVGTIPLNVDRVMAGDMERTRLQQVKVLFFAGVNDGYIPKNAGKGGILSDLEREFLAGSGKELAPSPRQQMYIQRLYLYLNLTKTFGTARAVLLQDGWGGTHHAAQLPDRAADPAFSLPDCGAAGKTAHALAGSDYGRRQGVSGGGTAILRGRAAGGKGSGKIS